MASNKVAIIGVGITKFGELWDQSYRDLITEAGTQAITDAEIDGVDVEEMFVGSMSPGVFAGQEHIGALVADASGLAGIPAVRVEAACASGSMALRQAYLSVLSGRRDIVIAGGVEKMTDVPTNIATTALMGAGDEEWEGFHGVTFPALYALIARRHMKEYGTTIEQISQVSVKNHSNAKYNETAQFRFDVSLEDVMNSSPVADPLRLLHCSPITDGAAVAILASEKKAKELCEDPVWINASGAATDTLALHNREDITKSKVTVLAARDAYKQAGVTAKDLDFFEVHDCFAIAELLAIEGLGLCDFGKGGKITEEGYTALKGEKPVNASGGLKGKGHPVGTTGVAQAVEATLQLRGEAGQRQVEGAEKGLIHNVGGSGATCVVHVLSR